MAPIVPIDQFCEDPNLLSLKLWPKQKEILTDFWGGNYKLGIWALGRRSSKTTMAAACAVYACCLLGDEYKKYLQPDEPFYVFGVATNQEQSKEFLRRVKAFVQRSPILSKLVKRETVDSLELSNGCIFRAVPATSRGVRGYAIPFLVFDEAAHFIDSEGNSAGDALFQALSPSVSQFGSLGKILMLSSPWFQRGIFWESFKQGSSGQFPQLQVIRAATWEVNPGISEESLALEKARDPQLFAAEYAAQFSGSIASFLDGELVDSSINHDRGPLQPLSKFQGKYFLNLDPARGGRDAYAACIGHLDGDRLVVDKWHEFKPSFQDGKKTQVAIAEVESWVLEQHKLYGFTQTSFDQYNSQSSIQRLKGKLPIEELTWTSVSKTQAFSKLRELFNEGNIEIYPHPKGIQQLKNLIVQYRANGSWTVTGGSGVAVDDFAMALAGVVLMAKQRLASQNPPPSGVTYNSVTGSLLRRETRPSPYQSCHDRTS